MEIETKHESEQLLEQKKAAIKKKVNDHASKFSGSRKSSLETTVTNVKHNFPRVENTFKLSPDDNKRFYAFKLKPHIYEILKENVNKSDLDMGNPKNHSILSRELANKIRDESKNLGQPRYKIVVFVALGDNVGQDVRVASRCLWNPDFDNCVSVMHNTKTIWATAVVYILYND